MLLAWDEHLILVATVKIKTTPGDIAARREEVKMHRKYYVCMYQRL